MVNALRQVFAYPFMVNAFRAGAIVAVVAGAMGWFMVLRRETFAGHTLSVVGFPGAAAAVLLGWPAAFGYFAFCIGAALVIGAGSRSASATTYREESALIGTVQAMALASGFLFVTLYAGNLNGLTGLLFGSFLGITSGQVLLLLVLSVAALFVLAVIGRRLLFASVDPEVAAAAGVRVSALSIGFLVLLGVAVAEASQITGSLLVFALLVLPPATAQVITGRPVMGLILSVALGIAVTWGGLLIAYYNPPPAGAFITTLSFIAYVVARIFRWAGTRQRAARPVAIPETA
ncbi:MAG TPA: metal ABC transporter permease [Actinomycetota bacterium]